MDDKELALKIKPYIKKFNFSHEQLLGVAMAIKHNQDKLQECIDYLDTVDISTNCEDIANGIIEICYCDDTTNKN